MDFKKNDFVLTEKGYIGIVTDVSQRGDSMMLKFPESVWGNSYKFSLDGQQDERASPDSFLPGDIVKVLFNADWTAARLLGPRKNSSDPVIRVPLFTVTTNTAHDFAEDLVLYSWESGDKKPKGLGEMARGNFSRYESVPMEFFKKATKVIKNFKDWKLCQTINSKKVRV